MEITKLKYFCALAQSDTLREAANLVNISPGALSKSIKQLEEELGTVIFDRENQRMKLNTAGKRVFQIAERIISEYENLKESFSRKQEPPEIYRIGSYSTFSTYLLGPFLQSSSTNDRFLIKPLPPGEIEQSLISRMIDFGITALPVIHKDLKHKLVTRYSMGTFSASRAFQGIKFENIPFSVPVVSVSSAGLGTKNIDGWDDSAQFRYPKYYVDSLETTLEICRQGLAAAVLPKFVINLHNKQVIKKFQLSELKLDISLKPIKMPIYLVTRKDEKPSNFHKNLESFIKKSTQ